MSNSTAPACRNETETRVDVRPLPPRERHAAIFNTWNRVSPGDAILLVNDHDPVPLYYQFACEHRGTFHWEYVEQGPDTWQVRIRKGAFADPGFEPKARMAEPELASHAPATSGGARLPPSHPDQDLDQARRQPRPTGFMAGEQVREEQAASHAPASGGQVVLDVRPIFERGETPCVAIDTAAAQVGPGQKFILLAPFEPVPLYSKLARQGFQATPQPQADGSWRIEFTR